MRKIEKVEYVFLWCEISYEQMNIFQICWNMKGSLFNSDVIHFDENLISRVSIISTKWIVRSIFSSSFFTFFVGFSSEMLGDEFRKFHKKSTLWCKAQGKISFLPLPVSVFPFLFHGRVCFLRNLRKSFTVFHRQYASNSFRRSVACPLKP